MAKSRSDCPLFKHRNGQWCKKVRGRLRYFGTDLDEALKRWASEKDHLLAGLDPPRTDRNPSIAELANLFMDATRKRVAAGDVRPDLPRHNERVIRRVIGTLGPSARLSSLTPAAWQRVRTDLASADLSRGRTEPRAATTVALDLARLRGFLAWCQEQKLIGDLDTGGALKPPPKRIIRRAKAAGGPRLWKPEELRAVIDAAGPLFRPVVLLAINAAMGTADIGRLRRSDYTSTTEFLHQPRYKTGVDRRVWLWPETRQAIDVAVRRRPDPQRKRYADRLLLTVRGLPWWRTEGETVLELTGSSFRTAASRAGVSGRSLYDGRRTFRTIASEVCDLEATDLVMGHEGRGAGHTYLQGVSDERIRAVCAHVRSWLFGPDEKT